MHHVVVAPIFALLAGAGLELLLARVLSARVKGWLALAAALGASVGVLVLWPLTYRGETIDYRVTSWDGPISLAYHVDGLAQVFALMGVAIGSAVLLYSIGYMARDRAATRFYTLMLLFIAGLVNLVYSADLLLMYASWELVGLCSFFLVGFWYTDREAAAGARKVLIMTHIAGYALLAAIITIYLRTGTTLWTDPRLGPAFTTGVFVLMLIAATAKSVQFPLHTWIPSAMAAPTPVSALLHAACYVKAGVYLVARMHSFAPWATGWGTTVVWLGTVTMLVGVLFAMVQHDLKKLLAFHTVSQIGYMMLGLGLGSPLGVVAGLLHCLNHGLFKGGLFLCAGAVQQATGTRDMDRLGGLARRMPRTTAAWLLLAGGIAGVPLLNGFVSKWLVYVAALDAGQTVPALVAWIVSVLTMFSFMKATSGVFFGEGGEATADAREAPGTMVAGITVMAAGTVLFGVAPQLPITYVIGPSLKAMGLESTIDTSWKGLAVPGGAWYTTAGLVLALVSLAVGALVWWLATRGGARPVADETDPAGNAPSSMPGTPAVALASAARSVAATGAPFTGGEPLAAGARLSAGDFSAILHRGLRPFYEWVDPDRYYLAVWQATLTVCAAVARAGDWLERHLMVTLPLIVVGIAGGAGLAASVTRSGAVGPAGADRWPLLPAVLLALAALTVAAVSSPSLRRRAWLLPAIGAPAIAALALEGETTRLLLLEVASFAACALVYLTQRASGAGGAYLLAVGVSAAALVSGTLWLDNGPADVVLALLLGGFALKLALVPAYLWLPMVAERTPAAVAGLVVAAVDVAAVAEVIALREAAAWLFDPAWPWLALALASALGGAALALAQHDVKRLLAFTAVADAGFLLVGITPGTSVGVAGATLAASTQALAAALLFTSVAAVEDDAGPSGPASFTLAARGLARRHPVAAAGFVVGALTTLGVPATAGYPGHWRVYLAAADESQTYLAALVVATALLLLALVRVVAVCWWGGGRTGTAEAHTTGGLTGSPISGAEAPALTVVIVVLTVVLAAAGFWPRLLGGA